MLDFGLISRLFFGKQPPFPGVMQDQEEFLFDDSLTMGSLYVGRQGTGKTSSLARHLVEYAIKYPGRALFSLDWSGSISNIFLGLTLKQQKEIRGSLIRRIVFDDLGNPEIVVPFPEFSLEYGTSYEDQVQRVSDNLSKLQPELVKQAPYLAGLTLREIAPQVCRLLTAVKDEQGEIWQITEAKKLLSDPRLFRIALNKFGRVVPEAKWFFESVYSRWSKHEKELRTFAFLALLGAIESREIRARIGYCRPGWTPSEAVEKGQIVLVNGSRLINRKPAQYYLFTQVFSTILAELNKRQPANPDDQPIALVLDETISFLSNPGMADQIGNLSPIYRSRKLELYIVIQQLSQLDRELRQQIWGLGNLINFAVQNFDGAYDIAQKVMKYDPQSVKIPPRSETGQPVLEPDRGQYLSFTNAIQNMKRRECIMRRYVSEHALDPYLRYIPQTKEVPSLEPYQKQIEELKQYLIEKRGIKVEEALKEINNRKLTSSKPPHF